MKANHPFLFMPAMLAAQLALTACDTTPRERQAAVREELRDLDSLADRAGDKLRTAGRRAARFDSASRARNRQPLDEKAAASFAQELLGTYADVDQLTVQTVAPAYVQLLRQTRAKRREWTQRDWDYATSIYRRLNERLRQIRLDLPARDEVRIRALQAEFTALESGRDIKDLGEAAAGK